MSRGAVAGLPLGFRVSPGVTGAPLLLLMLPRPHWLQLQFLSGASDGHSQLPLTKIPQEEPSQTRGHEQGQRGALSLLPPAAEGRGLFLAAPLGALLATARQAARPSAASLLLCWLFSGLNHDCGQHGER